MEQLKIIKEWLGAGSINVFGSPFSGKDTQGQRLTKLLNAKLIGGGEILRSTATKKHVKHQIQTGKLAPTEEYKAIVLPYLKQPNYKNKPLILSAVGRWHGEEESVIRATGQSGHQLKAVIFLELNEDEIWKRWKKSLELKDRGTRTDDTAKALKIRITEYKEKTLPVIEFYKQKGLLIKVNGNLAEDQVTNEIINKLAAQAG
jgi:adenylate kinase